MLRLLRQESKSPSLSAICMFDLQALVLASWSQNLVPKRRGIKGLESFRIVNVGGAVVVATPGEIHSQGDVILSSCQDPESETADAALSEKPSQNHPLKPA